MKTIWQHDCEDCIYLGPYRGEGQFGGMVFDLYWANHSEHETTPIARYGDDGPAYYSGLAIAQSGQITPLAEAVSRAAMLGLIDVTVDIDVNATEIRNWVDRGV